MRAQRLCQRLAFVIVCVAALLAGWLGSSAANPQIARADDLPEPICWRQLAFSIPFKVAAVNSPEEQPAEVRLYVSANQGIQWEMAQRVSPQENTFTFRAPHDGEYWFQIRTADRQGRLASDVGSRPELRVIVDTMKPRLDFTATRGEAGEVKATWQAVDPLLNPDSLKIEYQTSSGSWRAVAVDRTSGQNRSTSTGALTWYPTDAPAGSIAVRAEVSDQAGNIAESHALADLAGAAPRRDLTAVNSGTAPNGSDRNWISTPNPSWSSSPSPPATNSGASSTPPSQRTTSSGFSTPGFGGRSSTAPQTPMAGDPGATAWPSDRTSSQPLGRNPIPSDDIANSSSNGPYLGNQSGPPDQSPYFDRNSRSGDIASRAVENVSPPIRNQMLPSDSLAYRERDGVRVQPADSGRTGSTNFSQQGSANPSQSISSGSDNGNFDRRANRDNSLSGNMPPAGERPRMVNSRSFDLDYDIDGIGPSGIAKVQLWGTRDGGRTWASYGVDNDNRSPIHATVEGEGLYGFRIVVQSGNGLGGRPPQAGDSPDLWIMVDLTKPNVRLIDATAGTGPQAGELLIRWEAADAGLSARPITLFFSDRPGGPWSIIAAGLENVGQYAWRLDARAPDRIYLRIEARDEAGNVGSFEGAESVTLDRIRPEGRIRGVRPTNDTAARTGASEAALPYSASVR